MTLKSVIRAIGNPEIEFWSSIYASFFSLLLSICLIPAFGIIGAAAAECTWNLVFAITTKLRIALQTHKLLTSRAVQMET